MIAPSIWWEPLGLVTYEAYEHAKPMLAARSGGLAETVTHEKTGLCHDPGDVEELARQVVKLEASPGDAAGWGLNGRDWLESNTRPDDWREQFLHICRTAIDTGPRKVT